MEAITRMAMAIIHPTMEGHLSVSIETIRPPQERHPAARLALRAINVTPTAEQQMALLEYQAETPLFESMT